MSKLEKRVIKNGDQWPGGVTDGLVLKCGICDELPYIDYNVTNDFWNEVVPEKHRLGVICLKCLDKIATEIGYDVSDYIIRLQFTGNKKSIIFHATKVYYWE